MKNEKRANITFQGRARDFEIGWTLKILYVQILSEMFLVETLKNIISLYSFRKSMSRIVLEVFHVLTLFIPQQS